MKRKISITLEEDIFNKLEEPIKKGRFRNKSHVLEYATRRFFEHEATH